MRSPAVNDVRGDQSLCTRMQLEADHLTIRETISCTLSNENFGIDNFSRRTSSNQACSAVLASFVAAIDDPAL